MSLIIDTIQNYLPAKRKLTASGWTCINAVCCHHNGTTADTRQRGGVILNEGITYHCFNCSFKASWQPGRKLSSNLKKLMQWLGVPDDAITKCTIEAWRYAEDNQHVMAKSGVPVFLDKLLPMGAKALSEWDNTPKLQLILDYMESRNLKTTDYDWHWTDEEGFDNRLIVPFYYENRIVGYTARLIRNGKPRYISEQQPGYVFNLDAQTYDRKFVIVTEGPLDAICVDGIALMGSEISESQHILITRLRKDVILVPDRDLKGSLLVKQAIDYNWSVSFPDWEDHIKDVNEAVKYYGKLYTLLSIIQGRETSSLKIQLIAKTWFPKEEHEIH